MLNKDFFRILIKLIGLYFFIQVIFSVLPSQISFLGFDTDLSQKIFSIIYFLAIILVSILILYFLIRFPDKIINLFKLDKGFDNEMISIKNFDSKNILTVGVFIIGGFLILENITTLISSLYFELKNFYNPMFPKENNNGLNILFAALNIVLGSALILYRKNISEYFEK